MRGIGEDCTRQRKMEGETLAKLRKIKHHTHTQQGDFVCLQICVNIQTNVHTPTATSQPHITYMTMQSISFPSKELDQQAGESEGETMEV